MISEQVVITAHGEAVQLLAHVESVDEMEAVADFLAATCIVLHGPSTTESGPNLI
jgi:hypothetical protein